MVPEDFRQEILAESIEKFDKFGLHKMLNLAYRIVFTLIPAQL